MIRGQSLATELLAGRHDVIALSQRSAEDKTLKHFVFEICWSEVLHMGQFCFLLGQGQLLHFIIYNKFRSRLDKFLLNKVKFEFRPKISPM